jgi:hypothetical protein
MPFGMATEGKPLFGEPLNGSITLGVTCVPFVRKGLILIVVPSGLLRSWFFALSG